MRQSEYNSLISAIHRLKQNLIKWQYQAERRAAGNATINNQRDAIQDLLDSSPRLQNKLNKVIRTGYRRGRRDAQTETRLPLGLFPEICPFIWQQLIDEARLPAPDQIP